MRLMNRMQSMDTSADAGSPIRFVLSPRDDGAVQAHGAAQERPFLIGLSLSYRFEPEQNVCTQGDTKETAPGGVSAICVVVEKGNLQAFIEGAGRVHEHAIDEALRRACAAHEPAPGVVAE